MPPSASSALSTPPAIAVTRVSKLYGSFVALRDVSLTLAAGASVVLLGPNGAGKSTLLKLLAGLAQPSYGEVRLWGTTPNLLHGRIAYMGHQTMLYDELTGPENLLYMLRMLRPGASDVERRALADAALEQVALDPRNPRHVGEYSQGMRQRAALARGLLGTPDLLLLDEPFSNLDVASAHAMVRRLRMFLDEPREGTRPTLLLTTHQAELARPLADITLTLGDGRLTTAGSGHPPLHAHEPVLPGRP